MRDTTILEGFQRITDAISEDLAKVTRANAMLRTRIDAQERLLVGSRFGLLKVAILQLFSPGMVQRMLTAIHTDEIGKFNLDRQQAAKARPKVMGAPNVGLITVH